MKAYQVIVHEGQYYYTDTIFIDRNKAHEYAKTKGDDPQNKGKRTFFAQEENLEDLVPLIKRLAHCFGGFDLDTDWNVLLDKIREKDYQLADMLKS